MWRQVVILTVLLAAVTGVEAWSQAASFAGSPAFAEPPMDKHFQVLRSEKVAEYLELSEAQAAEWRQILDQHLSAARQHRDRIDALRADFRTLAARPSPNLEELGRLALELHREMQARGPGREQLARELEAVLSPEQILRFEAMKVLREVMGPRFGPPPHAGRAHAF